MRKIFSIAAALMLIFSVVDAATISEETSFLPLQFIFLTHLPNEQGTVTTTLPAEDWSAVLEGRPFTSTLPDGTVVTSTLSYPPGVGQAVVTTTVPVGNGQTGVYTTTLPPDWQGVFTTTLIFTTTIPGGGTLTLATSPHFENVVPAPASLLLLGSGLVGLAGFSLKKRLFRSR